MRATVCLQLAALATLAGCTSPSTPTPPDLSPSPSSLRPPAVSSRVPLATYRSDAIAFRYPRSWRARHFDEVSSFTSSLADVASQPMHRPCTTRHLQDSIRTRCGWPITKLRSGGVLIRWSQDGLAVPRSWRFSHEPGRPLTVDGRPARQTTTSPGVCRRLAATETIHTEIRGPDRGNTYSVIACLRGPRLPALERRLQAMLASARLRP